MIFSATTMKRLSSASRKVADAPGFGMWFELGPQLRTDAEVGVSASRLASSVRDLIPSLVNTLRRW